MKSPRNLPKSHHDDFLFSHLMDNVPLYLMVMLGLLVHTNSRMNRNTIATLAKLIRKELVHESANVTCISGNLYLPLDYFVKEIHEKKINQNKTSWKSSI